MKKSPNISPKTPNYALRQLGAGVLLLATAAGIMKGHEAWDINQRHVSYVLHPENIPQDERERLPVKNGDNAFDLAHYYAPDPADAEALTDEIQNQADKNGFLQPGQSVYVEKRLVSPSRLPELVDFQDPNPENSVNHN